MTSKIELICPSSYNSNEFFDINKPTLMVYSENNFYEPLCKLTRKNNRKLFIVKKFFSKQAFKSLKKSSIYKVIKNIKKSLVEFCSLKNSVRSYKYFINISPIEIINILIPFKYTITSQIINNNFQVIGLNINNNFYLPCKSSGVISNIEVVFVNENTVYQSYHKTIEFLQKVYEISENRIQSNPVKKIVDNEHIVGIITSANQFVPVIPEKFEGSEDIEVEHTYNIENQLLLDDKILKTNKQDMERKLIVKKITLENSFYNLFRNTLKRLLNYKQHTDNRDELKRIVNNPLLTYVEQMDKIRKILKIILKDVIIFQKIKLNKLSDYDNMITCIGLNRESCSEDRRPKHCLLREENGICRLILPKKNLYSKEKNKLYYYVKLSDELIRFSQIRKYIFTPKSFLSFHHVKYNINNDEIILLDEILDKYFNNIVVRSSNEYTNTKDIYELVDPSESVKYSENAELTKTVVKSMNLSKTAKKSKTATKISKTATKKSKTECVNYLKQNQKKSKTVTKLGKKIL